VNLGVVLTTFVVVFPAELPDKTMIATLVLGTRFKPAPVFVGAAAGFAVQVTLAVAAGQALSLLPKQWVDVVVAVLFAVGAAILLLGSGEAGEHEGADAAARAGRDTRPLRVALTAFTVVALAEFGDLTQIATANLAAKYHDPFSVGVGALVALLAVAALALTAGRWVVRVVPLHWVRRVAGVILAVLAVLTIVEAVRA
jgi:putative Ca2+/H+ antiporter (TMEM165/GDT1 family)